MCTYTCGNEKCRIIQLPLFSKEEIDRELIRLNETLNERGVYMKLMLYKEDYTLIYTYRKSHLEKDLKQEGVKELLLSYGYPQAAKLESHLVCLKKRLCECNGFPHEIGVFLGYPLEDVKGFIENKGQDCLYCGLWKVYCNEQEAKKNFQKLEKCTRVYMQVFAGGRSISQMTVSA